MTYSDVVMWMWVVALLATLGGLVLAGRAVHRAEVAVATVRDGVGGVQELSPARAELERAATATAGRRMRLHTRLAED